MEGSIDDLIELASDSRTKNATDQRVTWSSSNNNIATVSASGLVTARGAGSVNITATTVSGNRSTVVTITVNASVIVTFDGNGHAGGSPPQNINAITPSSIRLPGQGTMTRPGYTFIGWRNAQDTLFRPDDLMVLMGATSATVALRAYWVQNLTISYDVMTNWNFATNSPQLWVSTIYRYFMNEFGIEFINGSNSQSFALIPREIDHENACTRLEYPDDICNYLCGPVERCRYTHHRSAAHLLSLYRSASVHTYRFVNYRLCWYGTSDGNTRHREIFGLATVNGRDMLVTNSARNIRRTIVHEISHNLGVPDHNCTPNQECVMSSSFPHVHNQWCRRHWQNVVDNRWRLQ